MRAIGATSHVWIPVAKAAAAQTRALEKASLASDLGCGWGDQPQGWHHAQLHYDIEKSRDAGTAQSVPFRHAPRLKAAFVAQLLGQVLPDPEAQKPENLSAYEAPCRGFVGLCDRRL